MKSFKKTALKFTSLLLSVLALGGMAACTANFNPPTSASESSSEHVHSSEGSEHSHSSESEHDHSSESSHVHVFTSEVTLEPTCTVAGIRTFTSTDGHESYTEAIPATGHKPAAAIKENEKAATCLAPASYDSVIYCSVCHSELSREKVVVGEKADHVWGEWTLTTEPTCTEKGVETRVCVNDASHVETRSVRENGHKYVPTVIAPTCTEKGYTEYVCSVCGEKYSDNETAALDHNWTLIVRVEPTCTEDGKIDYECSRCGEKKTEALPSQGHKYVDVITKPTCTEKGYTTHTCSVCNDTYVDTYVDALGHKYGEWIVVDEASCTEAGLEKRVCENDETHVETRVIAAKGHTPDEAVKENEKEATCLAPASYDSVVYCSVCHAEISRLTVIVGEKADHAWGGWTPVKDASCDTDGLEQRVCATDPSHVETRPIKATGHQYVPTVIAPTCTEGGYTDYVCSVCGDTYSANETDALGHNWTEIKTTPATCTEDGRIDYQCSRCNESKFEIISAPGHKYVDVVTDPTCTSKGFTTHTCSECSASYVDSYVDALGHIEGHATCTKDYVCSRCNEIVEKATGHAYEKTGHKDATCTEKGYNVYVCAKCSDSYNDYNESALGHDYKVVGHVDATCSENGYNIMKCSRCDDTYNEITDVATGAHTYTSKLVSEGYEKEGSCNYVYTYEKECTVCHTKVTESVAKDVHTYKSSITIEATCSAKGTKTLTCTRCGASKTEDYEDASAHRWDDGVTTSDVTTYTCTLCSATKTVISYAEETKATVNKDSLSGNAVELKEATLALDETLLNQVSGEVQLSAEVLDESVTSSLKEKLDETALAAIGDAKIYDFSISDNNGALTDWNGGKITVTLPYTLQEGDDPDNIAVYYLTDEGTISEFKAVYSGGFVVFETEHFSYYTVAKLTPAQRCAIYGHNELVLTQAPTCTKDGLKTTVCLRCGETLSKEVLEATGHNYVISESVEANCQHAGYVVYVCSNNGCDATYRVDSPIRSHDYQIIENVSAGCENDGHVTYKCSICEDKYTNLIPAKGHRWTISEEKEASCQAPGFVTYVCANCDQTYTIVTRQLNHDFKAAIVEATCETAGYTVYTCASCNETYRDNYVSALGHDYKATFTWNGFESATVVLVCEHDNTHVIEGLNASIVSRYTKVSCTENSEIVYTATAVYNGVTYTDSKADVSVEALGHDWYISKTIDPSCGVEGKRIYACSRCEETKEEAIAALEHNFVLTSIENPTCTESGKNIYTCLNCSETKEELIRPLDHDWYLSETIDPSCGVEGKYIYACSRCEQTKEEPIAALEHNFVLASIENPTCTKEGKTIYTCIRCGDSYEEPIEALGHEMVQVNVIEPTCTEEGKIIYACSRCDETKEEIIPAKGHHYVDGVCVDCGDVTDVVCDHTNLTLKTFNFADYGACGGTVRVLSCDCGQVCVFTEESEGDLMTLPCGKYFSDPKYMTMEQDPETGTMSMRAVCPDCGLVVVGTQSQVQEGCRIIYSIVYSFSMNGKTFLEATYQNDYTNHSSTSEEKITIEGMCEGSYYLADICSKCGEIASVRSINMGCKFSQDGLVSVQETLEDGTQRMYQYFVCPDCGFTTAMEQLGKPEGCITRVTMTQFVFDPSGEEVVKMSQTSTNGSHSYVYTYKLEEGKTCEDGYQVIMTCEKCDFYQEYYSRSHNWTSQSFATSDTCGTTIILNVCRICGSTKVNGIMDQCDWVLQEDGTYIASCCGMTKKIDMSLGETAEDGSFEAEIFVSYTYGEYTYDVESSGRYNSRLGEYVAPQNKNSGTVDIHFYVEEAATYHIYSTGGAKNPMIRIYDMNGAQVAYDDDSGEDMAFDLQVTLQPGFYRFELGRAYDDAIYFNVSKIEVIEIGLDEAITAAPGASYYHFVAPEEGQYVIYLLADDVEMTHGLNGIDKLTHSSSTSWNIYSFGKGEEYTLFLSFEEGEVIVGVVNVTECKDDYGNYQEKGETPCEVVNYYSGTWYSLKTGEVILSLEGHWRSYSHADIVEHYEFMGETCLDGVEVTRVCSVCGQTLGTERRFGHSYEENRTSFGKVVEFNKVACRYCGDVAQENFYLNGDWQETASDENSTTWTSVDNPDVTHTCYYNNKQFEDGSWEYGYHDVFTYDGQTYEIYRTSLFHEFNGTTGSYLMDFSTYGTHEVSFTAPSDGLYAFTIEGSYLEPIEAYPTKSGEAYGYSYSMNGTLYYFFDAKEGENVGFTATLNKMEYGGKEGFVTTAKLSVNKITPDGVFEGADEFIVSNDLAVYYMHLPNVTASYALEINARDGMMISLTETMMNYGGGYHWSDDKYVYPFNWVPVENLEEETYFYVILPNLSGSNIRLLDVTGSTLNSDISYGEKDEKCGQVVTYTYSYVRDGEVLITFTRSIWRQNHNWVEEYKFNNGNNCDDGVVVHRYCPDCGEENNNYYGRHVLIEGDFHRFQDYGMCEGEFVIYECPACKQTVTEIRYYNCNFRYVSTDDKGVVYEVCDICGAQRLRSVTTSEKDENCQVTVTQTYTYINKEGELVVTQTDSYYETRHNWVVDFDQIKMFGKDCEDGYKVVEYCTDCGKTSEHENYGHATYAFEILDLSEYGSTCGGTIRVYKCPCGAVYGFDVDELGDLDSSYIDIEYNGQSVYGYLYRCAVTDPQCSFAYFEGYYWGPVENCQRKEHRVILIGYNQEDGTYLKAYDYIGGTSTQHAWENELKETVDNEEGGHTTTTIDKCSVCGSYQKIIDVYDANGRLIREVTDEADYVSNTSRYHEHFYVTFDGYWFDLTAVDENRYSNGYWYRYDYEYDLDNCLRHVHYQNSDGINNYDDESQHFNIERTIKDQTCTQDGLYQYGCLNCGKIESKGSWSAKGHDWGSWYSPDGQELYYCRVCGLVNANGANGDVIFEDLTRAYGEDQYYVIGYADYNGSTFEKRVSLVPHEGEEQDEIFIPEPTILEFQNGLRAYYLPKAEIAEFANKMGLEEGDYDVRFYYIPSGADAILDYAITITEEPKTLAYGEFFNVYLEPGEERIFDLSLEGLKTFIDEENGPEYVNFWINIQNYYYDIKSIIYDENGEIVCEPYNGEMITLETSKQYSVGLALPEKAEAGGFVQASLEY